MDSLCAALIAKSDVLMVSLEVIELRGSVQRSLALLYNAAHGSVTRVCSMSAAVERDGMGLDNLLYVANTYDRMAGAQALCPPNARFALRSERLGPLPLVNHFLARMGLLELLERHVPTTNKRRALFHALALGVLLRSIVVEREPIYRQGESAEGFACGLFGLSAQDMQRLGDDRIGRALDRLFDADRGALLTEVVVAVGQRFGVSFDRLHNDCTTVSFCGQYRAASGRSMRGRKAPAITYGHPKNYRPDLKQLLFILTVDSEGVPCQFRCADGNTSDSVTHIETWNTLRAVAGRADFLYVADSSCVRAITWSISIGPAGAS
jgi:hypothetical protein